MDALQIWREGNAAALEAVGYIIDADLCRRGHFDDMPSAKAFQEVIEKALLHPTNKTSPPCPKCGGAHENKGGNCLGPSLPSRPTTAG